MLRKDPLHLKLFPYLLSPSIPKAREGDPVKLSIKLWVPVRRGSGWALAELKNQQSYQNLMFPSEQRRP